MLFLKKKISFCSVYKDHCSLMSSKLSYLTFNKIFLCHSYNFVNIHVVFFSDTQSKHGTITCSECSKELYMHNTGVCLVVSCLLKKGITLKANQNRVSYIAFVKM